MRTNAVYQGSVQTTLSFLAYGKSKLSFMPETPQFVVTEMTEVEVKGSLSSVVSMGKTD